jgi:hypothetical protein
LIILADCRDILEGERPLNLYFRQTEVRKVLPRDLIDVVAEFVQKKLIAVVLCRVGGSPIKKQR